MIFKKLELQGFKTFFDRTEVHFRPGINAVVGPNGCGKSNIADAIRWVLGEQSPKQLRGEKMEDLIFSGSENRHPLGMAEVSLTVESVEDELPAPYNRFTEVCVTRRLYRSGESEFFINNTPCRLRDIRELFLDTGLNPKAYAVISQGSIGDIVSARAEDRRILIEEAAGVAKFKERKAAALRKLEATEQNLVRLADLTGEVKRQLGSLQRQARKAERYHEIKSQLEEAELRVLVHQHGALAERLRSQEERVGELERLAESLRAETATGEAALEAGTLEALEVERALAALREEFYALRAALEAVEQGLDRERARLAALERERAHGEAESARLEALIAAHAADGERIGGELVALAARLAERETLAAQTRSLLDGAVDSGRAVRESLEATSARLRGGARDESESQRRLAQIEAKSDAIDRDLERVRAELAALEEEDGLLAAREAELAGALAARRAAGRESAEALVAAEGSLALARAAAAEAEAGHAAAREELGAAAARLASLVELERSLSGWPERFQGELERILAHEDLSGALRGILADAIRVPPEHETALEAVLGERLKFLLVNSTETGIEAARLMREGSGVRGTFLPLAPRPRPEESVPAGEAHGERMLDSVKVPEELRPVVEHLLRDVYLVGDLGAASERWREDGRPSTYVTPAGEVLWPDGSVTGGRLDPARELLPLVRSIRETQDAASGAERRVTDSSRLLEEARGRLGVHEEEVRRHAGEGRRLELEIAALEKELLLARQKRTAQAAQRERLQELSRRAADERGQLDAHLLEERSRRNDLAAARARQEGEIAALEEALASRLREEKALMERLSALQVELAAGRERDAHLTTRRDQLLAESEAAAARRGALAEESARAREQSAAASAGVERLAGERARLLEKRGGVEARLNQAQDRHRDLSGRARETEERLRGLRGRREEIQAELVALRVGIAEDQVRREHLAGRCAEVRGCPPEGLWDEAARAAVLAVPLADLESAHRDLAAQLQALGPVNLAAIGDQRELQERLDAQRRQQEDLEQASRDLRQAIARINETSREKFLETFERVNEKFQEVFPTLLENGHALLRLTEGADPLDAGVEILAQPAGKKLKHISLLSGGEQALTAIALLLAIFMVKPAPFCLLDEVDAPLDESNILRFLRVLRRAVNGSQLVMITHNKRTMESSNHLVGVTMADPGVSRLISVQLREARAQAS